jgi:hypothetical protein
MKTSIDAAGRLVIPKEIRREPKQSSPTFRLLTASPLRMPRRSSRQTSSNWAGLWRSTPARTGR